MVKKASSTIAKNRRAYFDYELLNEMTAGIVLAGHEVKSIRAGNVDLKGSYVTMREGEAWLTNCHVKLYAHAGTIADYDAERPRKLLLTKKELTELGRAREQKLTIVPLRIFTAGQHIKIAIATARGKRKTDKRSVIRERDVSRDVAREIKRHSNS